MTQLDFKPGSLVTLRNRPWVVLPSEDTDLLLLKPLGGSDEEITGIYKPLANVTDKPQTYNSPSFYTMLQDYHLEMQQAPSVVWGNFPFVPVLTKWFL
jgi:hypothetical protein